MLQLKIDSRQINRILENASSYSYGFLEGTQINQIVFNQKLGLFIENALGKYIDSKAKMNPQSLHHVYEWNRVGSSDSRLFRFNAKVSKTIISITGKFLQSKSLPPSGNEPFSDKANIMENQIAVFVSPKNSSVLVFEDNGETIFTPNTIYIEHPGGAEVAESFAKAFDEFFNIVLTGSLLHSSGIFEKLSNPKEFAQWFPDGVVGGKNVGVKSGKKYMNISEGLSIQ